MNLRTITIMGERYLHAKDVSKYFQAFATSEETDTRLRIEEALSNIEDGKIAPYKSNQL